ncbi:MAG: F0F1 ATP synthase subunit delta [Dysgonamonadaceae bacterium]|jgi:F-type H+-transporting ATPase subunit delta|nr:F0F1 ATP synthase subunit delta [Dysgonamonadaceae bacterium]
MNAGIISSRYAKAIYQYASECKEESRLRDEMKILSEQFSSVHLLKKVLDDPTVSTAEKVNVLITAAGGDVSNTGKKAIRLVIESGRAHYMQNIALMYDKIYRKAKNINVMKLTMVNPAETEMQRELVDLVIKDKSEKTDFTATIDPDIIGGFVLEVEDLRLDASVKNQLNQLRLKLIRN